MTVNVMELQAKRDKWIAAAHAALAKRNLLQAEISCRKARRYQNALADAIKEASNGEQD